MKRSICLILLCLFLFSCGCAGPEKPDGGSDSATRPEETNPQPALRTARELYLTVWSWQIPTPDLAAEYAQTAKQLGFTGIDLCVLWEKIEPEQNRFDWNWLDGVTEKILQQELDISLELLLWTRNLSWAGQLALQETALGDSYEYEGRGGSLCLNDEGNRGIVKNTLQAFSVHCAQTMGDALQRWGMRVSSYGELEYAAGQDLDYAPAALRAFWDYIESEYGNAQAFAALYGREETTRQELEALPKEDLSRLFAYDWKRFKQQTLADFSALAAGIFHAAEPEIPVAAQIGSWADPLSALNGGILDPISFLEAGGADILHVADTNALPVDFLAALATQLAGDKPVAYEIEGAWKQTEDLAARAKAVGEAGLFSLNTANWNLEELGANADLLSQFRSLFFADRTPAEPTGDTALLVNTADFALRASPVSLYDVLGVPYEALKNAGPVRFVTDRQLVEHPELLEGIRTLCLGDVSDRTILLPELAELLLSSDLTLTADRAGHDENFFTPYGAPLDDETQLALRIALQRFPAE